MKYKRWYYILSLIFLLCVCLTGCGPSVEPGNTVYNRTVKSADGAMVAVPDHPKRIIALSSAYDTILLGLVDTDRFAGISSLSTYEQYSMEAEKAKQVKTRMRSYSLERIIALHPDLVIAPEYITSDVIEGLRHVGIPTVVVNTGKTVDEVIHNVQDISEIVNEAEIGREHVDTIHKQIAELDRLGKTIPLNERRRVLFVSSMDGYTGTGSLFDDMCRYMSIYNAPSAAGYAPHTSFTDERVIEMNPDYIFIPSYKGMDKGLSDRFLNTPAFQSLPAMKHNQVQSLPASYLYASNQHIGEAMLSIMYIVYPQLERNFHE